MKGGGGKIFNKKKIIDQSTTPPRMVQSIMLQKIKSMMLWTKVVHSQNGLRTTLHTTGNAAASLKSRLAEPLPRKVQSIMLQKIRSMMLWTKAKTG